MRTILQNIACSLTPHLEIRMPMSSVSVDGQSISRDRIGSNKMTVNEHLLFELVFFR